MAIFLGAHELTGFIPPTVAEELWDTKCGTALHRSGVFLHNKPTVSSIVEIIIIFFAENF